MSKELEALEKKFPDDGNGDDDAYNKGWNDCRERALALLTTRQEVAPVACRWKTSKAGTHWTYENGTGALALRANGWIVEELYTTTGQTSDARDATRKEAYDRVDHYLRNSLMDAAYAEYSEALEIACGYQEAAMQEAGK